LSAETAIPNADKAVVIIESPKAIQKVCEKEDTMKLSIETFPYKYNLKDTSNAAISSIKRSTMEITKDMFNLREKLIADHQYVCQKKFYEPLTAIDDYRDERVTISVSSLDNTKTIRALEKPVLILEIEDKNGAFDW